MTAKRDVRTTRPRRGLLMPVLVAVIAGTVTLAMVLTPFFVADAGSDSAGSAAQTATSDEGRAGEGSTAEESGDPLDEVPRRDPDDPMALGRADAPVVMVEYSDFQCPFCGKFARDTEPDLVAKYVDEGILRIEWRDFPYLGEESTTAALAGRAAAAQDKFWAFHEEMYATANALPPNSGEMTEDYLAGIAGDVGIDVQRFREDMQSTEASKAVQRDFREGQEIGVTGTPAFIINGDPIMGAQPTSVFVDAVEKAASDAR